MVGSLLDAVLKEYGLAAGMVFLIAWHVYHHALGQFRQMSDKLDEMEVKQSAIETVLRALSRQTDGVDEEAVDEVLNGEDTYQDLFDDEGQLRPVGEDT